jgi:hypothetical protein
MKKPLGVVALLAASVLLITGCTAAHAQLNPNEPAPAPAEPNDLSAAWLDDGRAIAIVTWGSSSCVPAVEAVVAEGQNVTVTLAKLPEDVACTMDYAPRASFAVLPDGVDPKKDVAITVIDPVLPDANKQVTLRGNSSLAGQAAAENDFAPTAGSFGEGGIVLLSWGSSSCPPKVENVVAGENGPTVTFATETGMCTKDMAPRLTLIGVDGAADVNKTLTLSGGFNNVTLPIIGN